MMSDPTIREQAYSLFLAEAKELLQTIEQHLGTLRVDRSTAKIHELRRSAHTLKGAAASVGLKNISTIAQGMESAFKALYKPEVEIDTELETLLLQAYDCLRVPLNQAFASGTCDEHLLLEQADPILSQIKTKLGHHFDSASLPSSKDLGVDVTRSLFEGEVQVRLEHLSGVIQSGKSADIATTLQMQAEVLRALAESQNLPGFSAIAQATIAALEQHPDRVQEIAPIALADFRRGQAAVLAGDRESGGLVSEQLKQWAKTNQRQSKRGSGKNSTAGSSKNALSRLFSLLHRPAKSTSTIPPESNSAPPTPTVDSDDDVYTVDASLSDFADCVEGLEFDLNFGEFPAQEQPRINTDIQPISISNHTSDRSSSYIDGLDFTLLNHTTSELFIHQHQQTYQQKQFQTSLSQWLGQLQHHQHLLNQLRDRIDQLAVPSSDSSLNSLQPFIQSALTTAEQLAADATTIEQIAQTTDQLSTNQGRLLSQLRDRFLQVQTTTIATILNSLPSVVQQGMATYDKAVELKISGTTTAINQEFTGALQNLLSHLIQITFEHGIETPEIRSQQQKPECGSIQVLAVQQGNQTRIEFRDDGQGSELQRDRILTLLRQNPCWQPGQFAIHSEPQQGTTVTLQLPLALITTRLLLCQSGQFTYGLFSEQIERVLSSDLGKVQFRGKQRVFCYSQDGQERIVPLHALSELVSYTSWLATPPSDKPVKTSVTQPILLLEQSGQVFALEVDRILEEQELVVRSMGGSTSDSFPTVSTPNYIRGFSVLGNGQTFLVIDAQTLMEQANISRSRGSTIQSGTPTRSQGAILSSHQSAAKSILVVDDSLTLRHMLTLTLQGAGYTVFQAQDGLEAIKQLQQHPEIKLVTCDVEMPRLDGFEFLTHCRHSVDLPQIPIVMITSQSNEQHQQFALELGASAYLTKPFVEDTLLDMLNYLLSKTA